ncbi:hypothetical protein RhiirC2_720015 [Rhizophagus irregularis]|uniref:Uncharacterized protein n=1 Tax=Rhizophagus irregularis TaxID=588596 RepID=A0A2N1MC06_9GLOM|nr:hypothetical protein RhiirC2_720015 [Rhizophagus irregularis]
MDMDEATKHKSSRNVRHLAMSWPFAMLVTGRSGTVIYNAGSNSQDVSKIIGRYTDDVKDASMVINSYLRRGEFIVFDLSRPEDDPLAIRLRGTEFMGECKDLLLRHGVKIQYTNSKRSVAIAERDHQEFEKYAYFWQDAVDFHLPLSDRSRAWVKGLLINDDIYNNTPTQLIGMSSHKAVKLALKGKKIITRPSVKHRRPVGYNEPFLPSYMEVCHLLEPGELEGGRRRATDCNWSPKVFTIDSYLIKENQPILY